jgi:hypothetical protein
MHDAKVKAGRNNCLHRYNKAIQVILKHRKDLHSPDDARNIYVHTQHKYE